MDVALIAQLAGSGWSRIDVVGTTGSTNDDLSAEAVGGSSPDRALVAAEQTSGRGRLERPWSSPAGTSVSVSVLLLPDRPASEWSVLPLLAGLAVAEAVEMLGTAAVLKWPNDVMLPEAGCGKVCGILSQVAVTPNGPMVVIGWGINVSQTRAELPVPTAASLAMAGLEVTREQVAGSTLAHFRQRFDLWQYDGWSAIAAAYRKRCVTVGQPVRIELPDGDTYGIAEEVTDSGQLQVRTAAGVRTFAAGDVVHVRKDEAAS